MIVIYWISIVPIAWQIATSVDRVTNTLLVGGVLAGAYGAGEAFRVALSLATERASSSEDVPAGRLARSPEPMTSAVTQHL